MGDIAFVRASDDQRGHIETRVFTPHHQEPRFRQVAERRNLKVQGMAELVTDACCRVWEVYAAPSFLGDLLDAVLRLPFDPGGLERWALEEGLLP